MERDRTIGLKRTCDLAAMPGINRQLETHIRQSCIMQTNGLVKLKWKTVERSIVDEKFTLSKESCFRLHRN